MNYPSRKTASSRDFMHDFQAILRDGENLFKGAGAQLLNEYYAAKECFGLGTKQANGSTVHNLTSLEESLLMQARDMVRSTDSYVKQHPWRAAAAGVCIGLIAGAMLNEHRASRDMDDAWTITP